MCIRAVNKYAKRVAKWQCFLEVYIYWNFNTHTHSRTVYINSEAMSKVSFWEISWIQSQGQVTLLTIHPSLPHSSLSLPLGQPPFLIPRPTSPKLFKPQMSQTQFFTSTQLPNQVFFPHFVLLSVAAPYCHPPALLLGHLSWKPASYEELWAFPLPMPQPPPALPSSWSLTSAGALSPFTCVAIIVLSFSCPHLPALAPLAAGPPPAPRCPQNQIETCQLENQTPF